MMVPVDRPREQLLKRRVRVDHGLQHIHQLQLAGLDVVEQLQITESVLGRHHELVEVQRLVVGASPTRERVQDGAG